MRCRQRPAGGTARPPIGLHHLGQTSHAPCPPLPIYARVALAGGGRFFKSSLCVHDDGGLVVVKVRCNPSSAAVERVSAPAVLVAPEA